MKTIDENLLARYQQVLTDIAVLTEEKEAIIGLIREAIPAGTATQVGNFAVAVGNPQERINNKLFQAEFPPSEFPRFYKQTVDTAAVRSEMAPAFLESRGLYQQVVGRVSVK